MRHQATPNIGRVAVKTNYKVWCHDRNGKLKWFEDVENLVVTEGLNELLTRLAKTVPGNVLWYVGLKSTGTPAAGDIMTSHVTWTDVVPYSNATRPAFTPGTVSGGSLDNSASKAVFNINATLTIFGAFFTDSATKSGTAGKLYGAGDFSASRGVADGDTLNVQVTLSVTAT